MNKKTEIENLFLKNNDSFPSTWNWNSNEKGLFYYENKTLRKRYGYLKFCEYCEREFLIRKDWFNETFFCSKYCDSLSKRKEIVVKCAWCDKDVIKKEGKLKNSKHGLYFCDRICKENAQRIGGIDEIQPHHYKDGSSSYSDRALKHYGYKCIDCNLSISGMLNVHHIDGNRKNGEIDNLEVVCFNHHAIRHMKFIKGGWVFNTKYLTPRNKLEELRRLLVI